MVPDESLPKPSTEKSFREVEEAIQTVAKVLVEYPPDFTEANTCAAPIMFFDCGNKFPRM